MLAITAARVSAAISSGLSVVTNSFPAVSLSVCPLIPGKQGRQFGSSPTGKSVPRVKGCEHLGQILYCIVRD